MESSINVIHRAFAAHTVDKGAAGMRLTAFCSQAVCSRLSHLIPYLQMSAMYTHSLTAACEATIISLDTDVMI